jgi:hypothetical protein
MWSPVRPWSPVRQWLRAIAAIVALFDESLRFSVAVESDRPFVHWSGGPSNVTICIRPARADSSREFGERAA